MKKLTTLFILVLTISGYAQPRESLGDRVRRAFSLVGRWEIIKMEVNRSQKVTNPNTVPEASLAEANVVVKSDLGSYGYFDVAPGGTINGEGEVVFQYRIAAGSSAFSMGPVPLAIGAVAMLNNPIENGIRKFIINGSADLSARTIQMQAFKPQGAPLQMIIRPGNKTFTSVLWPPMSNIVATEVIVAGSSLLFRASGVIQGIKVAFEAVKYVDLAGLFSDLDSYIDNRVTNIINQGGNTTNNNTGGNTTNNTTNNEEGSGGGNSSVAGFVNVPIGGSANVVFRTPRANTNYAISFGPMSGANHAPMVTFTDKTNVGFKVHVKTTGTGSGNVRVDWVVVPYTN